LNRARPAAQGGQPLLDRQQHQQRSSPDPKGKLAAPKLRFGTPKLWSGASDAGPGELWWYPSFRDADKRPPDVNRAAFDLASVLAAAAALESGYVPQGCRAAGESRRVR